MEEDAVLKIVHQLAPTDRAIADEFFGHFLSALMRIGHFSISEGLRRFVETGDLVNSVAGSLWRDIEKTEFHTRRQFLTYCGQRLQWKAADQSRGLTSGKRREDMHREVDVEIAGAAASQKPGPAIRRPVRHPRTRYDRIPRQENLPTGILGRESHRRLRLLVVTAHRPAPPPGPHLVWTLPACA